MTWAAARGSTAEWKVRDTARRCLAAICAGLPAGEGAALVRGGGMEQGGMRALPRVLAELPGVIAATAAAAPSGSEGARACGTA